MDALDEKTTPCAFCGHPDHQHRVREAIRERWQAGESIEILARDYGETVETIQVMITGEDDMSQQSANALYRFQMRSLLHCAMASFGSGQDMETYLDWAVEIRQRYEEERARVDQMAEWIAQRPEWEEA